MLALKTLIFTILAPGTVTVLIPYWILSGEPAGPPAASGPMRWTGWALITVGASIYLRCAWDFIAAGRGTPAPYDPPKELVVRGLYRFTRNPMYVGVVLVLLGEAVLFVSARLLIYALVVLLAFHLRVLFYEEPTLRRTFGVSYEHYCATVPRWVLRLPRRKLNGPNGLAG